MDNDTWQKKTHQLREWLCHYDGPFEGLVSDILRAGDKATSNEDRSKFWEATESVCKLISESPLYIPDKKREDYEDGGALVLSDLVDFFIEEMYPETTFFWGDSEKLIQLEESITSKELELADCEVGTESFKIVNDELSELKTALEEEDWNWTGLFTCSVEDEEYNCGKPVYDGNFGMNANAYQKQRAKAEFVSLVIYFENQYEKLFKYTYSDKILIEFDKMIEQDNRICKCHEWNPDLKCHNCDNENIVPCGHYEYSYQFNGAGDYFCPDCGVKCNKCCEASTMVPCVNPNCDFYGREGCLHCHFCCNLVEAEDYEDNIPWHGLSFWY